jgi:hypothetical protein
MRFAAADNLVAVNGVHEAGRQLVALRLAPDETLQEVGRVADHGGSPMAVRSQGVYVGAGDGVRRYTFPGWGGFGYKGATLSGLRDLVNWGPSVVAITQVDGPEGTLPGELHEIESPSRSRGLEIAHIADIEYGAVHAEAFGPMLALRPLFPPNDQIVVLELAMPIAAYLPSVRR